MLLDKLLVKRITSSRGCIIGTQWGVKVHSRGWQHNSVLPGGHSPHLERVAVQLTDVVRELLHIFSDALVCVGKAAKGGGSIVGTVAAVLLVQMVGQSALESNLDPFLHVLQTAVHHCSGDRNASKGSQEPGKLRKVLQDRSRYE